MSILTDDIETLLSGTSNLFIGGMPASPDDAVCIYLTGGFERSMSGTMLEQPTFQIKVRSMSQVTAMSTIDTIKDKLHTKSTTKILSVQQMGDIQPLGQDELKRWSFTVNFKAYFRR